MKQLSTSSYHSPEKMLFAISLLALLIGVTYACTYICPEEAKTERKNDEIKGLHDVEDVKMDVLRWLAPFKPMTYHSNPFNVRLKLKPVQPIAPPKKQQPKPTANLQKPIPSVAKPAPPPTPKATTHIVAIHYRGHYTNLSGVHYAMLTVTNRKLNRTEHKIMSGNEAFAEGFKLVEFDDVTATVTTPDNRTVAIPWNETAEIQLTDPSPQPSEK